MVLIEKTIVFAKLNPCMDPCVFCYYLAYCMERENLQYESIYFKELHNDREYYRPTIYSAGAAVIKNVNYY